MIRVPLTPADVANKQFKITFRGYSLDEVDGFLDEIEAELGRLMRDNAALREAPPAQAAPVLPPVFAQPTPAPAPTPAPSAPSNEDGQQAALRTLLLAQRTADEAVAEARADAARIVAEAEARAAGTDAEIARRLAEALGGVEARKRKLEQEIEELRVFEREYRVRLKAYLESQLSDIVGRGAPDDAGAGVPAAARTAAITGGSATAGTPSGPRPQPGGASPAPAGPPAPTPSPAAPPAAAASQAAPTRPSSPPPAPAPVQAPSVEPAPPRPAPVPPAGRVPSYAPIPPSDAAPSLSPRPTGQAQSGSAPSGPPREAGLRTVPPLQPDPAPEPIGPFTIVPPSVFAEQLDEGPEPPASP